MSTQIALRTAREFIKAENGEVAPLPISEEEINPDIQHGLSLQAYPLEAMTTCYPVNYNFPIDSTCSEFSFFQDGKQRTVQIGFIPTQIADINIMIPIHFFVVAAVILRREERELKVWQQPEIRSGIIVERSLVPNRSILSEFENQGLAVVGTDLGNDYYELRKRALYKAKDLRLEVENKLISEWRMSPEAKDHFLIIDGTLMNFRNEENVERCVGVSKSFGSRYFEVSDHNRIMRMREFERSWTFRFHSPEDEEDNTSLGARERISWYLRLRNRPNADPEFGLIRVEISKRHSDQSTVYADRISKSLLSERLPTCYPTPRWDKHLYPIRACENYLSSIMPSISTIIACMKG